MKPGKEMTFSSFPLSPDLVRGVIDVRLRSLCCPLPVRIQDQRASVYQDSTWPVKNKKEKVKKPDVLCPRFCHLLGSVVITPHIHP